MKFYHKILAAVAVLTLFNNLKSNAQGCVAIRGNGSFLTMEHPMLDTVLGSDKGWLFTSSYRYFKSFRHFRGREEQKERLVLGNEVINHQSTIDLSLTRNFNQFWSVTVGMPYLINTRSSLYEHGGKERHTSKSNGIGDMRIVANRWLFDSHKTHTGNIQVGLGVKLPTGDYNATSTFYNVTPAVRPVDQSIQLGDGGVGIIAEVNGFLGLGGSFSGYTNLYYMSNPRNMNGTRTYRETLRATLANEAITNVPDQYMARLGVNYALKGAFSAINVSAGARIEGIPVYDIFGKSDGFRRPGYVFSGEPALNYSFRKVNIFASVPIAIIRDRTQSVTDRENSKNTGTFVNGDAAFADYSINFGVSFKL
ncbi:hypothetical protein FPZ43_02665 [Mucilaginibacter pallidiroseus]|uniref:Outer membrane protein beta-barrel domain-containing protein n=1 Tax=Mucilaginibacter pallidiroseus TaxID=2599295 RepID=A0A563UJ54_9SPHI|nr:hypothetical protein [Mucilaginibacter pallidiroseus]TWR31397.1 hypothetical protein FPZ43_02665 [Mucilaginibacter pallidiroseus]